MTTTTPHDTTSDHPVSSGWFKRLAFAALCVGAMISVWAFLFAPSEAEPPFSITETDAVERLLKDAKPVYPDGFAAKSFSVRVEGVASPIAEGVTLAKDGAPVSVLAWRNTTSEPVLSPDVSGAEIIKVATAIRKYTKADDVLIGFPGFVDAVARLSDRAVLITGGGIQAPLAPEIWRDQHSAIQKQQAAFWRSETKSDAGLIEKFSDALLNDELTGAASLAALTKGKRGFLVLNITDVLRLGALEPDRFHIGYRDFPGASRAHGLIKAVKGWLKQNNHESYAVEQRDGDFSRVYFLGKPELKSTLIARALPFSTTNPMQLEVLRLVYQTGGTWVFQINPLTPSAGES